MVRVTLADVARQVGVSSKTVSNVVNGTGWVSDEVRNKVQKAITELGYRPNLAARQLRMGKSGMVGLALPDLQEPYFAELAANFVSAAQERKIMVLISQTGGDLKLEQRLCEGEGMPGLDALVMSPLSLRPEDLSARKNQTPMVLLGEQAQEISNLHISHVGLGNVQAAKAATEHLIQQGRTKIAALGVQRVGPIASSRYRMEGYVQALADAAIALDEDLLCYVDGFSRAEGSDSIQRLIDRGAKFDAVFCFNDSMGFGALHTLALNGLRVPQDVAVIGFDDTEETLYSVPPLSTIGPGPKEIARLVLDIVQNLKEEPNVHMALGHTLVTRGSSVVA